MSFLEMKNVSKTYGEGATEVRALSDIDFAVEGGQLVAVMGSSGSGKSTLLTIAGSLETPTRGEVMIGGAALSTMSRNDQARMRRRSIGYVFQDYNLLAGLSAVENVSLPLELGGTEGQSYWHGRARRARAGRSGLKFPRRTFRGRAPAGLDRPRRGRRTSTAVGRRTVGRP
jgi:putative ABC transport system ATP-binding protein